MTKSLISGCLAGVLCLLTISACNSGNSAKLRVATAANMQFAMAELTRAFKEESGIDAEIIVSSSGKLTAQIREGAPFDVFVSADLKYPQTLYQGGFSLEAPRTYAYGELVMWSMRDDLEPAWALLAAPSVKHIALANPKTAPYGQAAKTVLEYHDLYEVLSDKLVFGESIAQTNQFITSKAAEIGFTAKSVVLSPTVKGKGKWIAVDSSWYEPIAQGIVLLNARPEQFEAARRFQDFLFSDKGKEILLTYGYSVGKD